MRLAGLEPLNIGDDSLFVNVGERTNVTGSKAFARLILAGDYAGAYAFADLNLPVGVVTGAFGAPFLLWLLARGPLQGHRGRRAA